MWDLIFLLVYSPTQYIAIVLSGILVTSTDYLLEGKDEPFSWVLEAENSYLITCRKKEENYMCELLAACFIIFKLQKMFLKISEEG